MKENDSIIIRGLVAWWLGVRKNASTRYLGNGALSSMPMALIKSMYYLFLNRH